MRPRLLLLIPVLLLLAGAVRAEGDVLAGLFPAAKKMPALAWMKPGARVTWYVSDFIRYESKKKGTAGHGYCELYVVDVEPKKVVFEVRLYRLRSEAKKPARLARVFGFVDDTPGVHHRYWVHPDALANAVENPPANTQVTRGQIEQKGKKRTVVFVKYAHKESRLQWTLDAKTGLILRRGEAHIGAVDQRVSGALCELRETATVKLPWKHQENPAWLGQVNEIHFRGVRRDPTAPGVALPLATRFRKKVTGSGWAMFGYSSGSGVTPAQAQAALDAPGAQGSPFVSGGASPSGLWIDPEKLAGLEKGQRIMSNDVTGVNVTVFYVGPDQGRDVCVLRWANGIGYVDYVYDRQSGGLVRNVWQSRSGTSDYVMSGTR